MSAAPDELRQLADLLDKDEIYDIAAGAIADARDKGPRHPKDVDSADVLDALIVALRTAADEAAT